MNPLVKVLDGSLASAPSAIAECAQALASGQLVAFATETVYGLGANAEDSLAVAKIFARKGRPANHPLIVHIASPDLASHFASHIPPFAEKLMAAFWPGPLTLILPRKEGVAKESAGGQNSIGLRCPVHPLAQKLLTAALALGVNGVSAPSANRFGRVSPTSAMHVKNEFESEPQNQHSLKPIETLLVLDGGDSDVGIESTIIDCTRTWPVLLRPGMISRAQIEEACKLKLHDKDADAPRASGTLESHYAPRAKVILRSKDSLQNTVLTNDCRVYFLPATAKEAAHELFAKLRELDTDGVRCIYVEEPPQTQEWEGVRDRLQRASA